MMHHTLVYLINVLHFLVELTSKISRPVQKTSELDTSNRDRLLLISNVDTNLDIHKFSAPDLLFFLSRKCRTFFFFCSWCLSFVKETVSVISRDPPYIDD